MSPCGIAMASIMATSGQHDRRRCPRTSSQARMSVTHQAVRVRAWGLQDGQVYDRVLLPLPGLGSIAKDVPQAEQGCCLSLQYNL